MKEEKKQFKVISYELLVPKETKELIDLLDNVLSKVMNGEDISTYMELMDELYLAADGATQIPIEVKSKYQDEIAGYLTHKIMGTLLAKKK